MHLSTLFYLSIFFFLMLRPRPRSTLFPYTTLFRSLGKQRSVRCSGPSWAAVRSYRSRPRSEEHTSELQSLRHLVCRLLLEKKKKKTTKASARRHTLMKKHHGQDDTHTVA